MKILIADDDAVSRRLMQSMLQRSGYEVVLASDGQQACREISKIDGPKLALIDWMMPELDGPGVCREARRMNDTSYVYILLLTSKESHEDIVEGLEAGADDYLTKPCHPAELKARLLTGRRILELEGKLVEAREAMRFRATYDALTRLWNRSAILSHLMKSMERSVLDQDPVSILLCDIDHFKQVNDVHGHLTGDEVLAQVSARLQDSIRPNDRVGRYGGEEFLIVLSGCTAESLRTRAEQVRLNVQSTLFETSSGMLPMSISIGAATTRSWTRPLSVETLVKEADDALYRAKTAGRNRVDLAWNDRATTAKETPLLPLDPLIEAKDAGFFHQRST